MAWKLTSEDIKECLEALRAAEPYPDDAPEMNTLDGPEDEEHYLRGQATLAKEILNMCMFKVRYIGADRADIRSGEVYDAIDLADYTTMYGVIDRTEEMYAYPKSLFEIVTE